MKEYVREMCEKECECESVCEKDCVYEKECECVERDV